MTIPTVFDNVAYKVAGEYAYKGELIITYGIIYYFPHTDLIQQRINTTSASMMFLMNMPLGAALWWLGDTIVSGFQSTKSTEYTQGSIEGKEASIILQRKLEDHISNLKANRRGEISSTELPLPIKCHYDDVKELKLSMLGVLRVDANYDSHEYNIGPVKKRLLRESLIEAGFMESPVNVDRSKIPTPDSPYLKVYIRKTGEITLDGAAASIDEIRSAFAALGQKNGVVLYARDVTLKARDSVEQYEPHSNALKIIDLAADYRLPVWLCRNEDCSDAIGPNGKLRVEK